MFTGYHDNHASTTSFYSHTEKTNKGLITLLFDHAVKLHVINEQQ